jgi:hypothetical protein
MYFVLDYRQGNGHKKKNKRTNNGIHKQQKTEQYDVDLQPWLNYCALEG